MATYTGQNGAIDLGANGVGEIRAFEINVTGDTIDTTVMGDTWRSNSSTFRSWAGSMDVLYDPGDTSGQNALTVGSTASASFWPSGETTGHGELTGTIRVTERSIKTSHEGMVEMTVQFIGDGALVEGVVTP